ncbi:MAG: nucleotide exchange factor GrpE [Clostridiales bacterium]|nr:nucleotide exchange factor GrpE [Clostridiales bacterium]MCF8021457.1 nucleotide exchange factor GrpE [Clostridiales bacterium]
MSNKLKDEEYKQGSFSEEQDLAADNKDNNAENVQEDTQEDEKELESEQVQKENNTEKEYQEEIKSLKDELKLEKAKSTEYYNRLTRLQSDFNNFRKRIQKEKEDLSKYAGETLVNKILPVLDNFQRAVETSSGESEKLLEGVEMIYRQLYEVLESEGLQPVAAVGEEFDPNQHEAVIQEEIDQYEDNTVIQEMRRGYLFKDRLLRPAMVKVARSSKG